MTPRLVTLLYAMGLAVGIAVLYAFGLKNELIFDDGRLTDGTIFGQYGNLLQIKARMLSYGSFVWTAAILGQGWWIQRVVNIGLHIATALALYALTLGLLQRTQWADSSDAPGFASSMRAAARVGVALWAFNPVAVYAVAYLIQRSVLLATLLVVVACWCLVRGLTSGRNGWYVLSVVSYVLAVAAKEHAVTAILLAVPLFVFVRRPPLRRVVQVGALSGGVLALMGALLYARYGFIVGTVFDETSRAFAAQLEQQQPGISQHLYPLSIVNQASLFFNYGLLWVLPYVGWMSIDVRPSFPLSLLSWHLVGALAWIATAVTSAWLVIRRQDAWGLLGLCVLTPCLLYLTEFSTVWLQDPFVLYRSYLWAFPLAVLAALPLVGQSSRPLYAVALIVVALFAASSFERIASLQTPTSAWTDASGKIDRQAPANAVGRWRPLLNLGTEYADRGNFSEALRLFGQAEALGEPLGSARFNMGVSQQQLKQHAQALDNFAQAEAKGFTEAALYYQRGESQYALGRFADAFDSFSKSLQKPQAAEAEQYTQLRQAEAAVASRNFDAAIGAYQALIKKAPDKPRYQVGLSMAHVGKKDYAAAMAILEPMIAQRPTGPAYYARALVYFYQGNRAASAQDLEVAMRMEPNNPMYRNLQQAIKAQDGQPTGKSNPKSGAKP